MCKHSTSKGHFPLSRLIVRGKLSGGKQEERDKETKSPEVMVMVMMMENATHIDYVVNPSSGLFKLTRSPTNISFSAPLFFLKGNSVNENVSLLLS